MCISVRFLFINYSPIFVWLTVRAPQGRKESDYILSVPNGWVGCSYIMVYGKANGIYASHINQRQSQLL